jgi:hypothetical protein
MNKEQIIDEAYENYCKSFDAQSEIESHSFDTDPMTKIMFVEKIKNLDWFSETWGIKIEERDLDLEERSIIAGSNHNEVSQNIKMFTGIDEDHTLHKNLDDNKIPVKLITITYNNETIESYE